PGFLHCTVASIGTQKTELQSKTSPFNGRASFAEKQIGHRRHRKFSYDIDHNVSAPGFGNFLKYLATFDKAEVGVDLSLKKREMITFVFGPRQMIAYREP